MLQIIIMILRKLIKSLSYIEAKIDFAEDDLPEKSFERGTKLY